MEAEICSKTNSQKPNCLRCEYIEPINGLSKNVFEWGGQVSIKGLRRTQLIVLGAVLFYQIVLLFQFEHHKPLGNRYQTLAEGA